MTSEAMSLSDLRKRLHGCIRELLLPRQHGLDKLGVLLEILGGFPDPHGPVHGVVLPHAQAPLQLAMDTLIQTPHILVFTNQIVARIEYAIHIGGWGQCLLSCVSE